MIDIWAGVGLAAAWAACGALAYGGTLAHFQRKYPDIAAKCYLDDRNLSWILSLLGPFGLIICALNTWLDRGRPFYYGLQFRQEKK